MAVKYLELSLLLLLALISDLRTYKIKNGIVYTAMLGGLATNFFLYGVRGLSVSFLGMLIPVAALFVLFAVSMLGAGDIKLFSAVGSIMGGRFAVYAMAYSFIAGGIAAIILILVRKNAAKRVRFLVSYFKSCFLTLSILPYSDFEDKTDGSKFHFSFAVLFGSISGILYLYTI
jgi:prepilin peptidase CpaA